MEAADDEQARLAKDSQRDRRDSAWGKNRIQELLEVFFLANNCQTGF
jgi:hypothetical protein